MSIDRSIRRVGPPLLAFVVAAIGALLLVGGTSTSQGSEAGDVATLVAVVAVDAGTPVSELGSHTEVRQMPTDARAVGAVASVDELPDGVLAAALVPGQQVLTSSVGADPRQAVGGDLVAVSATLEPEQWVGPVGATGDRVDVYAVGGEQGTLIATGVLVLTAVDNPETLEPSQPVVVTLGVPRPEVSRVVGAIAGDGIWLVSS
jgi:hypothetical protein